MSDVSKAVATKSRLYKAGLVTMELHVTPRAVASISIEVVRNLLLENGFVLYENHKCDDPEHAKQGKRGRAKQVVYREMYVLAGKDYNSYHYRPELRDIYSSVLNLTSLQSCYEALCHNCSAFFESNPTFFDFVCNLSPAFESNVNKLTKS